VASSAHPHAGKKITIALLNWFGANARDLPWRRTRDPYGIWVSEIMLQQTQVQTVVPYWEGWMRKLPTIHALARATPTRIHKLWEGLGYYTRVRNMQRAARMIVDEHEGRFPVQFDSILALPGIGRYTAGAIASIAFNKPAPILDGNVMRVLTRLFALPGDPRSKAVNEELWSLSQELVDLAAEIDGLENACSHFNQSLMELGATLCTPRRPQCSACPVRKYCEAMKRGRVEDFPQLAKRPVVTQRRFAAFVAEKDGTFLVRQRPPGIVNAHLWEFPNREVEPMANGQEVARAALLELGSNAKSLEKIVEIRHSITRYRITLEVHRVSSDPEIRDAEGHWLPPKELRKLPFCSAHKRILQVLPR
jgi:A/G-specific adenine glycosylase